MRMETKVLAAEEQNELLIICREMSLMLQRLEAHLTGLSANTFTKGAQEQSTEEVLRSTDAKPAQPLEPRVSDLLERPESIPPETAYYRPMLQHINGLVGETGVSAKWMSNPIEGEPDAILEVLPAPKGPRDWKYCKWMLFIA